MIKLKNTVDIVSHLFCESIQNVLSTATNAEITFAPTIQKVTGVHLRPDVGCFVQFGGDYSGLMIINFSSEAALALYRSYMLSMGMPEDELSSSHTSDDVVDSIGELMNQIIGKCRSRVEIEFGLSATNNQPKAITILDSILLSIDTQRGMKYNCRRMSFKVGTSASFQVEISLENTEFIRIVAPSENQLNDVEGASPNDIEAIIAAQSL